MVNFYEIQHFEQNAKKFLQFNKIYIYFLGGGVGGKGSYTVPTQRILSVFKISDHHNTRVPYIQSPPLISTMDDTDKKSNYKMN